jgi:prepilin-type N-terminal cleavage/methylation domain-containing protein
MNRNSYNKGFTLIELSIALVIIGLLTGGILAGQSLINSARTNAFIKQIQQYDIAVANFQTNYNSLPGDTNILDGDGDGDCESGIEGDGDGVIESRADGAYFTCEADDFWPHLIQTKMLNDGTKYTYYHHSITWPEAIGKVVPKSKIGDNTGFFLRQKPSGWLWFEAWAGASAYEIKQTGVGTMDGFSVPAIDALAVESKIDDGSGGSGSIVATHDGGNFNYNGEKVAMWIKIMGSQSMEDGDKDLY